MQAIAEKAGINKALLHYYFRSKQKLFEVVFKTVIKLLLPKLFKVFEDNSLDFNEKLRRFIDSYITMIMKNPHIPVFIIHELSTNKTSSLKAAFAELNLDLSPIKNLITQEVEKGNIRDIKPEHLIINIIALCVFPVAASPIGTQILFNGDKKAYGNFLKERKQQVADFVINSIKL